MRRRKFFAWMLSLPFVGPLFSFLKAASAKDLTPEQCLDFSLRRMQYYLARDFPSVKSHVRIGRAESFIRVKVANKEDSIREKLWLSFESILFEVENSKTMKAELDTSMKRISNLLGLLVESFGNNILDVRLSSLECKSYSERAISIDPRRLWDEARSTDIKSADGDRRCLKLNWSVCTNGWHLCEKRDLRKSLEYVGFISTATPRFVMPTTEKPPST